MDDTAELLGLTAAKVYGFDLDALRPIAGRIGPSPDSLGQDPTRRSDPAERAGGPVVEGGVRAGNPRAEAGRSPDARRRHQERRTWWRSKALQVESVG